MIEPVDRAKANEDEAQAHMENAADAFDKLAAQSAKRLTEEFIISYSLGMAQVSALLRIGDLIAETLT